MGWEIRPARADDGSAILRLMDSAPQPGAVTLNFERRPNFFHGAAVSCEQPDVWIARKPDEDGDDLAAVFNIGWRRVFVNGEERRVRYAHDLRLAPRYRGGLLLHRMFRRLRRILEQGEWMQTVILEDNLDSINTVGSGRAGLPVYYPCGRIETSLLYTRRRPVRLPADVDIRPARQADLPAMQAFLRDQGARKQFFPACDLAGLTTGDPYYRNLGVEDFLVVESGGRLLGMLGTWDQKAFKQTRVVRYAPGMNVLRHAYNLHSLLRGGMRLPPAGGTLSYLSLHSILVRDNDPDILRCLLDFCIDHFHERYDALVCGFFRDDPLRRVPAAHRRQLLHSRHYLVSFDGDPRDRLDAGRIPYVDVARL